MIAQKCPPALARRPAVPLHHIPRDSRLSDFEAELQQLAMDAGSAPERVIQAHLIDQRPELRLDLRAPSSIPRFPSPVTAKPSSMPAHPRLWPDDVKNLQYRREPAIQLDEEQATAVGQPNPAPGTSAAIRSVAAEAPHSPPEAAPSI